MTYPVVFDIETQHTFREVNHDYKKLKVSVAGVYDYACEKYESYFESELDSLFKKFEKASFLIGFNIDSFDLPVLAPYYLGNIKQFPTLDLLSEVERSLGFRVALDDLARATLGTKKSGHGFLAIDYFNNKQWDKLKNYCLDDVKITKEIYEYGKKNGKLLFATNKGVKDIKVSFDKKLTTDTAVTLSLPF